MNLSFYTASVGAQQQQDRLDVHANNIANVNTYGFRAKIPSFQSLMTGPVQGINEDLMRGVGSRMVDAETDFRTSGLLGTDRLLDFAIEGNGFFGLADPVTGEISYTRDGSFALSEFFTEDEETGETVRRWHLSDGLGRFVLGVDGQPVVVTETQNEQLLGADLGIGIFDFVNYNGMQSMGDNRLVQVAKNGQAGLGDAKLVQGYLELSNADLANELAKVIEAQRSFQYMLRMVTTSDEIETTVNNLR